VYDSSDVDIIVPPNDLNKLELVCLAIGCTLHNVYSYDYNEKIIIKDMYYIKHDDAQISVIITESSVEEYVRDFDLNIVRYSYGITNGISHLTVYDLPGILEKHMWCCNEVMSSNYERISKYANRGFRLVNEIAETINKLIDGYFFGPNMVILMDR
jgi:hypothetical protein